jgi:hypothetical protein
VRPGSLLAPALCLALGILGAVPAAGAGERPAQAAARPALRLVEQAPWVPMGFDLEVGVEVDAPPDAQLTLTVHNRVDDRAELLGLLGGAEPGTVLGRRVWRVGALARDRNAARTLSMGTQLRSGAPDDDLVSFQQTGVYPVRVVVDAGDAGTASLMTFAIVVDAEAPAPARLPVALVVPVQAAPLEMPDGSADAAVVAQLRPGGRLERLASELDGSPTPLSVAVGPETVQSWAVAADDDSSLVDGLEALRSAVGRNRREVLAAPFVRLDLPAIAAHDLDGELAPQIQAGAEALAGALGVRVDTRQLVAEPADEPSLRALRENVFVDRVVVPESSVTGTPPEAARRGPYRLDVDTDPVTGTAFTAALSDPLFSTLTFIGGETPLRAQRFLAALAVDATAATPSAGAVVTFPHDWAPEAGFLEGILAGLADHPLFAPVTLGEWFDRVPTATDAAGNEIVIAPRPIDVGTPAVTAEQLADARTKLSGLRSLVGDDPSTQDGAAAILRAPSADFTGPAGADRVREDLHGITRDAETFLAAISTEDKTVTITGDRATIPITLRNDTGRPVQVRLVVRSSKLLFRDGPERVLVLPEGTSTEPIAVEARASGTFPMFVSLSTEDDVFTIGPVHTITVRTTVFSGIAGWISVGAASFLGLWWLSHAVRARRRRAAGAEA